MTDLFLLKEAVASVALDGDTQYEGNTQYEGKVQPEKPQRIQRKRTKGFNLQAASPNGLPVVYVGRPTKWGNPFTTFSGYPSREALLKAYRDAITSGYASWIGLEAQKELRGVNLACWCRLDQPCHADILLELANK